MSTITKANVSEYTLVGEYDIAGTLSADSDAKQAKESKRYTLRVDMAGITLPEVIQGFLANRKITWANGERKEITFSDGAVIKITARTGGRRPQESAEDKLARETAGMTEEEMVAYLTAKVKAIRSK